MWSDRPSTTSGPQVPLNLSIPLAMCDGCGIDHWFPHCPKNPTMSLATCDQCGIDHLFAQCPRKSPNSRYLIKSPRDFPSLNAQCTRLQAEAKPIIEAKDTSDAKSTKMIKRKPKKKKSKKGKKKVVGTKEDPVTIKEINEDSDDSLLSECTRNPPKVVRKQAPNELQKVVDKQVAKESPKVVDISAPKPPS